MSNFLDEKFKAAKYRSIILNGRKTVRALQFIAAHDAELSINLVSTDSEYPQRLELELTSGDMQVKNQKLTRIVLKEETGQKKSSIFIRPKIRFLRRKPLLMIWNSWNRSGNDEMLYANGAMQIEETGLGAYRLYCNDGPAELEFKNMIIDLELKPEYKPTDG